MFLFRCVHCLRGLLQKQKARYCYEYYTRTAQPHKISELPYIIQPNYEDFPSCKLKLCEWNPTRFRFFETRQDFKTAGERTAYTDHYHKWKREKQARWPGYTHNRIISDLKWLSFSYRFPLNTRTSGYIIILHSTCLYTSDPNYKLEF